MNPVIYRGCHIRAEETTTAPAGVLGPRFRLEVRFPTDVTPTAFSGVFLSEGAQELIGSGDVVGASIETVAANSWLAQMLGRPSLLATGLELRDGSLVCVIPARIRHARRRGLWAGALLTALGVGAIARAAGAGSTPALLVVAGFAVTAGLGTLTTLVLLGDPESLDRYRFWTVGSLTGRGLDAALALAPLVVAGALVALSLARALDALALGDDVARGLGFRLGPTRTASLVAIVLLAGTATALAGPLVFVGLIGAHAARAAVGGRHALLLPVAAVAGAGVVLAADVVGRLVAPPGELEVGIVIAALGAPLLIALARSRRAVAA